MNKSLEFVKKTIATQGGNWPYDDDKDVVAWVIIKKRRKEDGRSFENWRRPCF